MNRLQFLVSLTTPILIWLGFKTKFKPKVETHGLLLMFRESVLYNGGWPFQREIWFDESDGYYKVYYNCKWRNVAHCSEIKEFSTLPKIW